MKNRVAQWCIWPAAIVLVLGTSGFLWYRSQPRRTHLHANANTNKDVDPATEDDDTAPPPAEPPSVDVVKPQKGAMAQITVQTGSVHAESVHLLAKVSGYMKMQSVDIGSRVKKGQVLAVVDVPELEKTVEKNAATVDLYKARVKQMKAKVTSARADREASLAQIVQAEANAKAASAWVSFRSRQYLRMNELFKLKSIDEKLVDEAKERYEAAIESESAAKAAIVTSKANATSADAKIQLAEADVSEAEAQVKVAEAEMGKSEKQLEFARIIAPFDGIVTQRTLFPGDFVRSAGEGGNPMALFTVQPTDPMRVVVYIPDSAVELADIGDPAIVEISALHEKFPAKISRMAYSEDPQTRLMRVELDLPNPKGRILPGMSGPVTITLDRAKDKLSIPSACLVADKRFDAIYVVRDGKAHLTRVMLGIDNGERVMIRSGLKDGDQVIVSPRSLRHGCDVKSTLIDDSERQASN